MALSSPVVVMGVTGSGKSTVGSALAAALGVPFVDGDALHPAANVAKMSAGDPLDDVDRGPWLDEIGRVLAEGPVVVACSALKRAYRDRLRRAAPELALVHLHGERDLLASRMGKRVGHFMPSSLLDSQLATLEDPDDDEEAIVLDVAATPDELVERASDALHARGDL